MEIENIIKELPSNSKIFNDGKAGIVEVTIADVFGQMSNNYRYITFQDSFGCLFRQRYNYLDDKGNDYKNKLHAQGIVLRHYWEVIVGKEPIPLFKTARQMLDTILHEIFINSIGRKFRIAVDYGIPPKHISYLVIKKFTPFIEEASCTESKLILPWNAYMVPASGEIVNNHL